MDKKSEEEKRKFKNNDIFCVFHSALHAVCSDFRVLTFDPSVMTSPSRVSPIHVGGNHYAVGVSVFTRSPPSEGPCRTAVR